jgi:hypothetical protein
MPAFVSSLPQSAATAVFDLIGELQPDVATPLDPANPVHHSAMLAALAAAGRSADRYPGLHARLAQATSCDTLTLVDKGRDRSGRATAMTWLAASMDPLYTGATLFVLDDETNELLALGHNSNVGEGFVPVSTDTATAQPAKRALKMLAVAHSVSRSGQVRFTGLASGTTLDENTATITVTQPAQTPKVAPNLVIALGRDSQHPNADADYTFTEPYNMDTPYLIVPFAGIAVLPYDVQGTPGQPIAGATLTTQIYFGASGQITVIPLNGTYTPASRLQNGVTMAAGETNMVEWSYPADGGSYNTTTALVYNMQSVVNDQISYFLYAFQIPVANAAVSTFPFAICSTGTPNEPTVQCVTVPPLKFWWHCLAKGTRVTLADGTHALIEDLDNTRRVATGTAAPSTLSVEATSRGPHQADAGQVGPGAVYRLVTDQGHELVGTGMHVILTPDGARPLTDLVSGDLVMTDKGPSKISSCTAVSAEGMFYNLKLGDATDREEGLDINAICTYVANGIVVGDHTAFRMTHRKNARDVVRVGATLPVDLALDYASAVADIRY